MLRSGREVFVTLRGCRFTCNGCYSWWNNDRRFWVTLRNGIVDDLAIVRPVCRYRSNVGIDLFARAGEFAT